MIFCDMTNVFVPSNNLAVSQLLEPILNAHNKEEYPPMHTAEHILNGTMVKMFGCIRGVVPDIQGRS